MAPSTPTKNLTSSDLVHSPQIVKKNADEPTLYQENEVTDLQEEASQDAHVPTEDPTPRALDSVTWGYAAVHIHSLDPNWNRDDPDVEANRELDKKHAQSIAADMVNGMKIADGNQRICISMKKEQIKASLFYTATYELFANSEEYEKVKHLPETATAIKERSKVIENKIRAKVSDKDKQLFNGYRNIYWLTDRSEMVPESATTRC